MLENSDLKTSLEQYSVSYRNVKYPRLEFKTGNLILVLPKEYQNGSDLLEKHHKWIAKKRDEIQQAFKLSRRLKLNESRNDDDFKKFVNSTIKKDEGILGIRINKLFYRRMKSKWGSLSGKGNLTLNSILRYLPDRIISYVIFHEIAHSISRKHDKKFWNVVSTVFPDHNMIERELFAYWFIVQRIESFHSKISDREEDRKR